MERKHKSQPTVNKEIKPEVDREDFDMKISRPAPSPPAISMNLTRVVGNLLEKPQHADELKPIEELMSRLMRRERILEQDGESLCKTAMATFMNEENEQCAMESTVSLTCICGIQHPELKEAHEIMKSADSPPDTKYEFLGDNMNGNIETFLLLIGLKCLFPERIMLIRNQDSRQTTRLYGYYDECIRKYGNAALWESMEHLSGVAMDKRVFMFKEWFECEAIGAIRKDSH